MLAPMSNAVACSACVKYRLWHLHISIQQESLAVRNHLRARCDKYVCIMLMHGMSTQHHIGSVHYQVMCFKPNWQEQTIE